MSGSRIADPEFRAAVERLAVPGMGTEAVAPLLSGLVRFLRPRRVLEVGMGYTTPFLAAALADTAEEAQAESDALASKTRRHLAGENGLGDPWLMEAPTLVSPAAHLKPYRPELIAVDDLSMDDSSAPQVMEILDELGLDSLISVVNAELHEARKLFPDDAAPIDFAWVDAWECLYFFDHFWDLINPDGGLVIMHYLVSYPEGEALLRYIAEFQRSNPGELEVVSLLESHKLMQNSITVLRRISGAVSRNYAKPGGRVDYSDRLQRDAEAQALRNDAPAR